MKAVKVSRVWTILVLMALGRAYSQASVALAQSELRIGTWELKSVEFDWCGRTQVRQALRSQFNVALCRSCHADQVMVGNPCICAPRPVDSYQREMQVTDQR
jgi:cytochrome c553